VHGTNGDDVAVCSVIAHHPDALQRRQDGERLPQRAIEPGGLDLIHHDPVSGPQSVEAFARHFTDDPYRQTRPRKWLAIDHVVGQAERQTGSAHLVFEEIAKRLDELEPQVDREAADVVMRLDPMRIDGVMTRTLDHVGIERALSQKFDPLQRRRLALEYLDERCANPAPLLFGIDHALQHPEELAAGVHRLDLDAQVMLHHLFDAAPFVATEQPIVDEQAGQLSGKGTMDERGADRGIDAAGKGTEHPATANLLLDRARGLPAGASRMVSPWLIHTGSSAGRFLKSGDTFSTFTRAGPYSRFPAPATRPPSWWARSCIP
jgi:hypothetical protein